MFQDEVDQYYNGLAWNQPAQVMTVGIWPAMDFFCK